MIILLITLAHAHMLKYNSKVEQLSQTTLDLKIEKGETFMAIFYAPWCGHCKQLLPIIDDLADQVEELFAIIDCVEHPTLRVRFNIQGYPTILLFKDNKYEKFSGQRKPETLIAFFHNSNNGTTIPGPIAEVQSESKFNPYITATVVILSIVSLVLISMCFNDYKEQKKLDKIEKEMELQRKQQ